MECIGGLIIGFITRHWLDRVHPDGSKVIYATTVAAEVLPRAGQVGSQP